MYYFLGVFNFLLSRSTRENFYLSVVWQPANNSRGPLRPKEEEGEGTSGKKIGCHRRHEFPDVFQTTGDGYANIIWANDL